MHMSTKKLLLKTEERSRFKIVISSTQYSVSPVHFNFKTGVLSRHDTGPTSEQLERAVQYTNRLYQANGTVHQMNQSLLGAILALGV